MDKHKKESVIASIEDRLITLYRMECKFPEAKLMADDLVKLLEKLKETFRNEKETGD